MLTMDARLGYTEDVGDIHANWTEVARSTEDRPLHCSVTKVALLSVDTGDVSMIQFLSLIVAIALLLLSSY